MSLDLILTVVCVVCAVGCIVLTLQVRRERRRDPLGYGDVRPPDDRPPSQGCTLPPPGWYCTREVGHSGPCAALPNWDDPRR